MYVELPENSQHRQPKKIIKTLKHQVCGVGHLRHGTHCTVILDKVKERRTVASCVVFVASEEERLVGCRRPGAASQKKVNILGKCCLVIE